MANWEIFEEESSRYLNELYKHSSLTFKATGGKDSQSSDIKVFDQDEYLFSIEAKYAPSQSGQFVLMEEEGSYILSPASKFENNDYTQQIIDHLNEHKETYSPKGQKSIEIDMKPDVLAGWVREHYRRKDSHLIITSTKLNDYKVIVPIENINDYFDVSAVIRRKRSGTSYVAKRRIEHCVSELKQFATTRRLHIKEIVQEKKPYVVFHEDVSLTKTERYVGEDYFLSPKKDGGYYLKTRSKTNNLNVIFSLHYVGPEENIGLDLLDEKIRNVQGA